MLCFCAIPKSLSLLNLAPQTEFSPKISLNQKADIHVLDEEIVKQMPPLERFVCDGREQPQVRTSAHA